MQKFLGGFVLALLAGSQMAQGTVFFTDGSLDPTTNNSFKNSSNVGVGKLTPVTNDPSTGQPGTAVNATTFSNGAFSLVSDPAAFDGKAFEYKDTNNGTSTLYNTTNNAGTGVMFAALNANTSASTVVMRIRMISLSGAGGILGMDTTTNPGPKGSNLWEYTQDYSGTTINTTVEEQQRTATTAGTVKVDTGYHILRIKIQGINSTTRALDFYYDENPTPILDLPTAGTVRAGALDAWLLGSIGSSVSAVHSGTADYVVDWIAGSDSTAIAPGDTGGDATTLNNLIANTLGTTPEPTTVILLLTGLPLVARRRRAAA